MAYIILKKNSFLYKNGEQVLQNSKKNLKSTHMSNDYALNKVLGKRESEVYIWHALASYLVKDNEQHTVTYENGIYKRNIRLDLTC